MASKLNSEEVAKLIHMDKINNTEKKKRGRPKKNQQYLSSNIPKIKININENDNQENEEIILHLPISKSDIQLLKDNELTIEELNEKINDLNDNEDDDDSDEDDNDDKTKNNNNKAMSDLYMRQYGIIIKKLKEDNDKLVRFLEDITPMYNTEVKVYPINLNLFDFENNNITPKKTNICCWWCTYQFEDLPTYLPEKYHDNKFYVRGCFCSFNCAGAYNLNLNDSKVWERYSLLKQMYYMINKDKINKITDIEINVAGPKELLERYGGPLSIQVFRKDAKVLGREYHELIPPFIPIMTGFEETTNSKINNNNINSIINNNSKFDNMMKRSKPLNNIASKHIDNFIE